MLLPADLMALGAAAITTAGGDVSAVTAAAIGAGGALLGALVGAVAKGVADYLVEDRRDETEAWAVRNLTAAELVNANQLLALAATSPARLLPLPNDAWNDQRAVLARHLRGDSWHDLASWYALVDRLNRERPDGVGAAALHDDLSKAGAALRSRWPPSLRLCRKARPDSRRTVARLRRLMARPSTAHSSAQAAWKPNPDAPGRAALARESRRHRESGRGQYRARNSVSLSVRCQAPLTRTSKAVGSMRAAIRSGQGQGRIPGCSSRRTQNPSEPASTWRGPYEGSAHRRLGDEAAALPAEGIGWLL